MNCTVNTAERSRKARSRKDDLQCTAMLFMIIIITAFAFLYCGSISTIFCLRRPATDPFIVPGPEVDNWLELLPPSCLVVVQAYKRQTNLFYNKRLLCKSALFVSGRPKGGRSRRDRCVTHLDLAEYKSSISQQTGIGREK